MQYEKIDFYFKFSFILANVERQIVQTQQSGAPFASSATKELDDLMASLSDFKVCEYCSNRLIN